MLKAVLVKVRQSFVQGVTRELPPEIFVKEVIPLPRTKSPDIFQVHLMHELFDVAVLANRRVYPMSVECIKPLVLVAQGPQVVDIHGHFSLTGIATRMSASSPLAPTAELREVPHLRCSKRCPSWPECKWIRRQHLKLLAFHPTLSPELRGNPGRSRCWCRRARRHQNWLREFVRKAAGQLRMGARNPDDPKARTAGCTRRHNRAAIGSR